MAPSTDASPVRSLSLSVVGGLGSYSPDELDLDGEHPTGKMLYSGFDVGLEPRKWTDHWLLERGSVHLAYFRGNVGDEFSIESLPVPAPLDRLLEGASINREAHRQVVSLQWNRSFYAEKRPGLGIFADPYLVIGALYLRTHTEVDSPSGPNHLTSNDFMGRLGAGVALLRYRTERGVETGLYFEPSLAAGMLTAADGRLMFGVSVPFSDLKGK